MSATGIATDLDIPRDECASDFSQRLQPRELLIARALANGQSMPAIAVSFHVSMEGLMAEINGIFRNLGVATLAHMLLLFAEMPELRMADIVYVDDFGTGPGAGKARQFG